MRFTASLRKDETAKTVRPMGVPEKGPATVRTRPAVLPRKDRMRMVLAFIRRMPGVNGAPPYSLDGGRWRLRYSRRMRRQR